MHGEDIRQTEERMSACVEVAAENYERLYISAIPLSIEKIKKKLHEGHCILFNMNTKNSEGFAFLYTDNSHCTHIMHKCNRVVSLLFLSIFEKIKNLCGRH